MTTHTTTLADFLLARIAEDEAVAKAVAAGLHAEIPSEMHWEAYPLPDAGPNRWTMTGVGVKGDEMGHRTEAMFQPDAQHIARHDPARVLAECEAKRRIVEIMQRLDGDPRSGLEVDETLRILAAVYADHPDYQEAWRA